MTDLATDAARGSPARVIDGLPAAAYHAHPALSCSGGRLLLPPSCPAKYIAARRAPTKPMEFGTAAHTRHLGIGAPLHVIDAPDWRKQAPRDEAAAARAAGEIPVLAEQAVMIDAMTEALAAHRTAAALFAPGSGLAEQSIFWDDPEFGIARRARLDWLPHGANGLVIIPDYKTTADASPDAMRKSVGRYGYHRQGDWYGAAVAAARPGAEVRFVLVAQETEPPYLVACYDLHPRALEDAADANRRACEIFRDCLATGVWPGYDPGDGITTLTLPGWAYLNEDW
jgi:PDDEXK-like domain of unknown function (DUF3799)